MLTTSGAIAALAFALAIANLLVLYALVYRINRHARILETLVGDMDRAPGPNPEETR